MSCQFTYEPNRKIVTNKRVERSDDRKYVCVKGRFSDSRGLPASVSFFPFPLPLPFFFSLPLQLLRNNLFSLFTDPLYKK